MSSIITRVNSSKVGQIVVFLLIVLTVWGFVRRFVR